VTTEFVVKDSGERRSFDSGMVRDTAEGKVNFLSVRFGPMLRRWAAHLTKGREKYPDVTLGVPNWTLAKGLDELLRAKESAARHFEQWLAGERDEDHASAVFFNINVAEYVLEQRPDIDPTAGVTPKPETAKVSKGEEFTRRMLSLSGEQDASLETRKPCTSKPCVSCECRSPHCHTGLIIHGDATPEALQEARRAARHRAGI
jgi:hypothetical protein